MSSMGGDTATIRSTGQSIESAGWGLDTTVDSNGVGCGSSALETALGDFGMRMAIDLNVVQQALVDSGAFLKNSASEIEAADQALADEAGN